MSIADVRYAILGSEEELSAEELDRASVHEAGHIIMSCAADPMTSMRSSPGRAGPRDSWSRKTGSPRPARSMNTVSYCSACSQVGQRKNLNFPRPAAVPAARRAQTWTRQHALPQRSSARLGTPVRIRCSISANATRRADPGTRLPSDGRTPGTGRCTRRGQTCPGRTPRRPEGGRDPAPDARPDRRSRGCADHRCHYPVVLSREPLRSRRSCLELDRSPVGGSFLEQRRFSDPAASVQNHQRGASFGADCLRRQTAEAYYFELWTIEFSPSPLPARLSLKAGASMHSR
jgi:hypothetical protein